MPGPDDVNRRKVIVVPIDGYCEVETFHGRCRRYAVAARRGFAVCAQHQHSRYLYRFWDEAVRIRSGGPPTNGRALDDDPPAPTPPPPAPPPPPPAPAPAPDVDPPPPPTAVELDAEAAALAAELGLPPDAPATAPAPATATDAAPAAAEAAPPWCVHEEGLIGDAIDELGDALVHCPLCGWETIVSRLPQAGEAATTNADSSSTGSPASPH
jgi:hypothetical protein